jgi:lysophospholipid acyltransferase (LPLAT)-like uncharacterized protein
LIVPMSSPPETSASTPRKRKATGIVVPHPPRWYQWIAAWLIVGLIKVISATLRYRWQDVSGHFDSGRTGSGIFCVWHNRLGLAMPAYYGYVRKKSGSSGLAAMVSASKDGGLLAAILECFKVQPVRGSTSRRGPQALLELTTWAERGFDLAITPDGPRGPCYEVQDGVMSLAQITGLPIIPFSYYSRWKLRVNSWDKFQIPLPFSYCEMRFGKPIHVPRGASEEERADLRRQLESTLRTLSKD